MNKITTIIAIIFAGLTCNTFAQEAYTISTLEESVVCYARAKTVKVKGHFRTTKTGKKVYVRPYSRRRRG